MPMKALVRHFLYAAGLVLLGMLCVVVLGYAVMLQHLPELKPWHTVELTEDFHAGSQTAAFSAYLEAEDRVFAEMHDKILEHTPPEDRFAFNRYNPGSLSDPELVEPNWNRTFELGGPAARGGVLLLHGLSDSPYSLRSIGEQLNEEGWKVLGMRLPAHGTIPGALRNYDRDDARAATRIGMRHLKDQLGEDAPLIIVGYSSGATLAADYALQTRNHPDLPGIDGLILLSPAFAVAPIAALAKWQSRVGKLLGIDKLAWQIVTPEFDPYKYNSFAVHAGDQIYQLTLEVDQQLLLAHRNGPIEGFPPTLAFQSVADATVHAPAVATRLLGRLGENGSALVLYDINRHTDVEPLYRSDTGSWVAELISGATGYSITLLTNRDSDTDSVEAITRPAGASTTAREHLDLKWPSNVYSLAHVALCFPPDDPVYGAAKNDDGKLLDIGAVELRGETGVLAISASLLSRLRHNPFYSYQALRIRQFAQRIIRTHSSSQH